ncbi:enoyl-[acyl-carrier protein] reductase II [Caldalkalibacillus uzonensis]|uniref:Probable nitronate monooxygenase n=1 Tax=Caldalkalibacillus uzonensis TaxID=353224 RepID=A0ABU0CRE5_9BACI|nr:nitronate monooxygenase [Caldalkalibacillus uzonensis]MDQ0338975.1 enoyl-[acyl-carrier protein] reductase II [Caldalkalibacillus uzonensis]
MNWTAKLAAQLKPLTLKYPIIQGGMGNISPPELCVAVSRAGGLGQIGAGSLSSTEVEQKLQKVKEELDEGIDFGVNVPLSVQPDLEKLMDLLIDYQVPVVSLSAGNPKPWIPKLKEAGIKVLVVVATVKQAQKAEAAGADLIVAEGFEAAGKNSSRELTTMTLIPQITQHVQCPVIAAGGIGDGRGLLASLALGAKGVQLGTRLIATKEAYVHVNYQQAILSATDEDTIVVGRRYGLVTRLLNTPYARVLHEQENKGLSLEAFLSKTDEDSHHRGAIEGLLEKGHVNAGQISGAINDIVSVAELLERMMDEAQIALERLFKGGA